MSKVRHACARAHTAFLGSLIMTVVCALPVHGQHEHHPHSMQGEMSAELRTEIDAVRKATARYLDHANAVADGYVRFGGDGPLMGEHWYRPDLVRRPLDLAHPSTLQYATIDGRMMLIGVAYTLYRAPSDPIPEGFAGEDDVWHVHDVERMRSALTEDRPLLRAIANRRARQSSHASNPDKTLLTMVHAWIWLDNPAGLFAQHHLALPYLRAGLPVPDQPVFDAASGIALLAPNACRQDLRRLAFVAQLSDEQRASMREACDAAAEEVRRARSLNDPATLETLAADAWRRYAGTQNRVLSAEQKLRLQSMVEHPDGHSGGVHLP